MLTSVDTTVSKLAYRNNNTYTGFYLFIFLTDVKNFSDGFFTASVLTENDVGRALVRAKRNNSH